MASVTLTAAPGVDSTGEVIQRNSQSARTGIQLAGTWDEKLFSLSSADWNPAGNTLTEVGAFTNYSWTSGDRTWLILPNGDFISSTIVAKNSNDEIELTETIWANLLSGITTYDPGLNKPNHIEARVVNDPHGAEVVGWTRLEHLEWSTPFAWTAEFTASVPTGGFYNWEYRIVGADGTVIVSNATDTGRWAVGAVFVLAGQSNMLDMYYDGDTVEATAETPQSDIGYYGPGESWYRLSDVPNTEIVLGPAGAAWTAATKTLTKTGAFTSYTHSAGDKILLFKTGVFHYLAEIASKTDNDNIVLVEEIYATDLTAVLNQQRPAGLTAMANEIRQSFPSVPTGFIGSSFDGTAIKPDADYLGNGHWLDGSGVDLTDVAFGSWIKDATRETKMIEAWLWQQGEAEATSVISVANDWEPTPGYYFDALTDLETKVRSIATSWREVPVLAASVGRYHGIELDQTTTANAAIRTFVQRIATDQAEWMRNRGYDACQLFGLASQSDGVHYTAAARTSWGQRFGMQVGQWIGDTPAVSKSSSGPKIISATFGDEVTSAPNPTDTELSSKLHITLRVQHDQGTDLTLGTHSHVCFTVADQDGPLYVSAVTKGPAVSAGGTQLVLLTVERDTAQTDGADRPYAAPPFLNGAAAVVQYLYQASIPHGGSPLNRLIYDNATIPMPLQMPTAWTTNNGVPRQAPGVVGGQPVRTIPRHNAAAVITANVTDVTNIATNRITIDAPNNWANDDAADAVIKPGNWFIVSGALGVYVGEGTVKEVRSYTNESTAVELDVSHDFTGQLPTTSHRLDILTNPQTEGGILALARTGLGFGGASA